MPQMNLDEYTIVMPTIVPTSATVSQYSSSIDTKGYHGALVIAHAGKNASGKTVTFKVREGLSTLSLTSQQQVTSYHTDVSGAAFTAISTSNDISVYTGWLNLEKRARFISLVAIRTGATCSSGLVILTRKQYLPTTQVNSVAFNV